MNHSKSLFFCFVPVSTSILKDTFATKILKCLTVMELGQAWLKRCQSKANSKVNVHRGRSIVTITRSHLRNDCVLIRCFSCLISPNWKIIYFNSCIKLNLGTWSCVPNQPSTNDGFILSSLLFLYTMCSIYIKIKYLESFSITSPPDHPLNPQK